MRAVFIISIFVFLISCQSQTCRSTVDLELAPANLNVKRLEQRLFESKSVDDVVQFLTENPDIARHIFYVDEYPDKAMLADRIFGLIKEPSIDTLYWESVDAFDAHEEKLIGNLEQAFAIFNYFYPDAPVPELKTIVTGLYHDLYISDEQLIVGIDYFIGPDATYRPNDIPEYILERYTYDHPTDRDRIVLDCDEGRFMNHSDMPNVDLSDPARGTATRDIAAGEELTCDYRQFCADGVFFQPSRHRVGMEILAAE